MARIEQLVKMVDRPGRPREFRFRRLEHTQAQVIAEKVLSLAEELQDIPVTVAATATAEASSRPSRRARDAAGTSTSLSASERAVYLDTDERTNRILMIGREEQLQTVEGLIDILDVPQDDLPVLKAYQIKHVSTQEVVEKLDALGITENSGRVSRAERPSRGDAATGAMGDELKIAVLTATNSLLINTTREKHDQIQTIIGHIDVPLQDNPESSRLYPIEYADAEEVVRKFAGLGSRRRSYGFRELLRQRIFPPRTLPSYAALRRRCARREQSRRRTCRLVVLEATNSLLVYATDVMHDRLQAVIPYIDVAVRRERIPYEIYFLESQDPERLAEVLTRLVKGDHHRRGGQDSTSHQQERRRGHYHSRHRNILSDCLRQSEESGMDRRSCQAIG